MEELDQVDDAPAGKQCYFLTQVDQEESRIIRTTLVVMTEVFCPAEDLGKHIMLTKPARSDISGFFARLSAKILRALDNPPKDNRCDPPSRLWP